MRATPSFAAIIAIAVIFVAPMQIFADSTEPVAPAPGESAFPFRLSPVKEAAIGAVGLGLYGSSFYLQSIKPNPNQSALDPAAIPFFDRLYTTSHSAWMGTAADVLTVATALVPAALIPGLGGSELLTVGVMYAETLGMAYAVDASLKSIVTRYRPYAYAASPADFSNSDIAASFPSNHASIAFASAVFAGYVFDEIHPDSPWRPLVWASGLGLATVTSVFRVASGDHFPSDVVAGAAIGALCGYLVPLFHKKAANPNAPGIAVNPIPGGLLVVLNMAG
jgi:membrane-associated phospholipid phosphatase